MTRDVVVGMRLDVVPTELEMEIDDLTMTPESAAYRSGYLHVTRGGSRATSLLYR